MIRSSNNPSDTYAGQPMRVLITGRRANLRSALKAFLHILPDLDVVAEATDAETLLTQAEATQPDVILLDRDMCDRPLEEVILYYARKT